MRREGGGTRSTCRSLAVRSASLVRSRSYPLVASGGDSFLLFCVAQLQQHRFIHKLERIDGSTRHVILWSCIRPWRRGGPPKATKLRSWEFR
eukprot:4470922-Pyramimonas_sp.AAC.1